MRFVLRLVSCCSACFELDNDAPYYAPRPYRVFIDGNAAGEERAENVFSLFGLAPDTEYAVCVQPGGETLTFRTGKESARLFVRAFGAVGDGIADDTRAVQSAIDACPPGGRVTVGPGVYRVAPLALKSCLTLELMKNAVLLGSANEGDYPVLPALAGEDQDGNPLVMSAWEGRPHASHQSLLGAFHARDMFIVGEGALDGNARDAGWWVEPKKRKAGRPRMLFLNGCENVAVHGVHVTNAPAWNLHPFRSRGIGFYDIDVTAPKDSPNTDGCDPESCEDVTILGARFSVGDDAIAIKSGKAADGELFFPPARRHTIRNCHMRFAHGAVVLGSEMSGGIGEIEVKQCLFADTDRGLRIKTRRGRGKYGVIDGVTFENIRMTGVKTPLVINMFYFCDPDGHSGYVQSRDALPVDERTPYLGAFTFRNLVCEDCRVAAGCFYGLPEQPVGSVTIEDAAFSFAADAAPDVPAMMDDMQPCAKRGLIFSNVDGVCLNRVSFSGIEGERVSLAGVKRFWEDKTQWTR
ncbi:MAG TPA: glycoside hydrolase family 28 protein [Clostridia bacterium]|nr:glycoside hydrolase family 28 protein [Clostridia bacterium]